MADPDSVFWHYNALIQLGRTLPMVTTGTYELLLREYGRVFAHLSRGAGEALLVLPNFYGEPTSVEWPADLQA